MATIGEQIVSARKAEMCDARRKRLDESALPLIRHLCRRGPYRRMSSADRRPVYQAARHTAYCKAHVQRACAASIMTSGG